MNPSIQEKLEQLAERQEEINALLSDPSVIAQQDSFRNLSIELADISPVVTQFQEYQKLTQEFDQAEIGSVPVDTVLAHGVTDLEGGHLAVFDALAQIPQTELVLDLADSAVVFDDLAVRRTRSATWHGHEVTLVGVHALDKADLQSIAKGNRAVVVREQDRLADFDSWTSIHDNHLVVLIRLVGLVNAGQHLSPGLLVPLLLMPCPIR